jgi:hypothetical protein
MPPWRKGVSMGVPSVCLSPEASEGPSFSLSSGVQGMRIPIEGDLPPLPHDHPKNQVSPFARWEPLQHSLDSFF